MSTDIRPSAVAGPETRAARGPSGTGGRVGLDEAWDLSPRVSIRPEPFGALVYHFGNRKLSFLKRPELLTVVQNLATAPNVATALDEAGVAAESQPAFLTALDSLAAGDMIQPRA